MTSTILLGAVMVLPALALVLLRSNAAIVFFSLCAGYVLTEFMGDTTVLAVAMVNSSVSDNYVQLGILFIPSLVLLIALRKSVSPAKLAVNILPAFAVGLAALILAFPILPRAAQTFIKTSQFWTSIDSSKDLIIGGGVLISLLALWLIHHAPKDHGGKGSKKKH